MLYSAADYPRNTIVEHAERTRRDVGGFRQYYKGHAKSFLDTLKHNASTRTHRLTDFICAHRARHPSARRVFQKYQPRSILVSSAVNALFSEFTARAANSTFAITACRVGSGSDTSRCCKYDYTTTAKILIHQFIIHMHFRD